MIKYLGIEILNKGVVYTPFHDTSWKLLRSQFSDLQFVKLSQKCTIGTCLFYICIAFLKPNSYFVSFFSFRYESEY